VRVALALSLVGAFGCYELEAAGVGDSPARLYRLNRITGEICAYIPAMTVASAEILRAGGFPQEEIDEFLTSSKNRENNPRWCFK